MKLGTVYGPGRIGLSYEVFPPKTEAGEGQVLETLETLMAFRPSFVSCTYGAGGSTRDKTLDLVAKIQQTFRITTAAHHTCVDSSVAEIRAWLRRATDLGIENIVALRGDPPKETGVFVPPPDGFAHANELVAFIRREFPHFGVAVGGYPETHREASSPEEDLANLKRKVAAGADVVLTQLFYRNADFFEFRRRYQAAGIGVPLVPGILPVISRHQIQRIVSLGGVTLPAELLAALEARPDDPEGQLAVGVEYAVRQCRELLEVGVPGLHFYILNRAEAPRRILQALPPCG